VGCLAVIKAVLFDLYGTLAYQENPVTNEEVSECLFGRNYEVSPQQLRAAFAFVAFIDYPKHGYRPDYIIRYKLNETKELNIILEVKGYESEQDRAKQTAAKRWIDASIITADSEYGNSQSAKTHTD
jgi:FMN phosphatase YigB (HAD superfamily)